MSAFDLVKPKAPVQETKELVNQGEKSFIPLNEYNGSGFYGGSSKTNSYKTKSDQLQANLGWVFKGNDRLATSCANVELQLFQKQYDGDREEVTSGEFYDALFALLDTPNARMTGKRFRKLMHTYMNLNGENYMVAVGMGMAGLPLALHELPAHHVQYILNEDTGREMFLYGGVEMTFENAQVWRDCNPDPYDLTRGVSIIEKNAVSIDMEEQSKMFNQQFFANAARPSILVEVPKVMDPKAYRRFQQQIEDEIQGTANAYRPFILEGGATGKPFALNQRDMDFLDSRKFSKDEILAMFGVSPGMLGMTENVNRSNMEAAEYIFSKYEVRDRVAEEVAFWNKYLLGKFPDYELDFVNPVPEDAKQQLEEDKASVNNWKTVNEIRADKGLPEIEGGDVIPAIYEMLQKEKMRESMPPAMFTGAQFNQPALTAAPEAAPAPDQAEIDENDPNAKSLASQKKALASMIKESGILDGGTKAKKKRAEQRNELGIGRVKFLGPELGKFNTRFVTAVRSIFEAQRGELIRLFSEKSLSGNKSLQKDVESILSNDTYRIDLDELLKPIYNDTMVAAAANANSLLPIKVGSLEDTPEWTEWITGRSGQIATDINAETQKQILAAIADGLNKGETVNELRVRIEDVMGPKASIRSERIARTEAKIAASQADIFVWTQSGVVIGKEWFSQSGHPCPQCASQEGRIVPLEVNFFDKGETHSYEVTLKSGEVRQKSATYDYSAIAGPPLHPDCYCVMLPVVKTF